MSQTRTVNAYAAFEPNTDCKPWQYEAPELKDLDIEIKISHCGICGSDIHTKNSGWGPTMYPCVVGHEIVGEITQAGPGVKDMKIGDRVGVGASVWACLNRDADKPCAECASGEDQYCSRGVGTYNSVYESGNKSYGGYADYVRVEHTHAFKIPENIESAVAAPLLCAGATVYTPLRRLGVKAGDRVGVVGIGGLGHLALQFINALDATPIAFSRSANKEQEVRNLGAKEFVNTGNEDEVKKAANSCDYLIVTANAKNMPYESFFSYVRPLGTVVMLGVPEDKVQFVPFGMIPKGRCLMGSLIGSTNGIRDMLDLASRKNVRPVIQKLPMSKVNEGIQMVEDNTVRYRCVLEN